MSEHEHIEQLRRLGVRAHELEEYALEKACAAGMAALEREGQMEGACHYCGSDKLQIVYTCQRCGWKTERILPPPSEEEIAAMLKNEEKDNKPQSLSLAGVDEEPELPDLGDYILLQQENKLLREGVRALEMDHAQAMALVMSHEGTIFCLREENAKMKVAITKAAEEGLRYD